MHPGVVITGVGLVTPLGLSAATTWTRACAGGSGIRPLPPTLGTRFACTTAGWIDVAATRDVPSRTHATAILAAREAFGAAAVPYGARPGISVLAGNNVVELGPAEKRRLLEGAGTPSWNEYGMAAWLARRLGLGGGAVTCGSNCVAGVHAIILGANAIRAGRRRMVLVGGVDCAVTPEMLARFTLLRALAPTTCRPFDREHEGMVLGDGAAFLVLEEEASARRRGASVLARLAGWCTTADAFHPTRGAPDARAKAAAIRGALAAADATPDEVDLVSAHGTGTLDNDVVEVAALRRAFGAHAERVAVAAAKGALGHSLAGSGAIETVLAVLTLRDGCVPPIVGFREPAEACALGGFVRTPRLLRPRLIVKNAFAFGGFNASLVLRAA